MRITSPPEATRLRHGVAFYDTEVDLLAQLVPVVEAELADAVALTRPDGPDGPSGQTLAAR